MVPHMVPYMRVANAAKILAGMRDDPQDWRIEDVKTVAKKYGISYRQQGTSHVTFRHSGGLLLTIPARRPIKPPYIRKFVALIDSIQERT
jgi:predicted RNA binding protein YcfA (HicA-like mRNA interferase family)